MTLFVIRTEYFDVFSKASFNFIGLVEGDGAAGRWCRRMDGDVGSAG